MDINDGKFKAFAVDSKGKALEFDAIECLVNHLKSNPDLTHLKVTDYKSGNKVDATSSYYLKSNKLPSPMGANITGYGTQEAALKAQKTYDGDVMNWTELKERFRNSNFGIHHMHHHNRPDMYGPAGVMGDHLHHKGGLMFSVRHMDMVMEGVLDGTEEVSQEELYNAYMMVPNTMRMQMTMLGVMYAPTNKLTVMAMQSYIQNDMDMTMVHRHQMNGMMMYHETDFSTRSTGLSDLKISALVGLLTHKTSSVHANLGFNIPTGSIERTDETPMNENARLAYAMQIGSGTFDARLGATYRGSSTNWSWGAQQLNLIRIGTNKFDYRFGNRYQCNAWVAHKFSQYLSTSVRLNGMRIEAIQGMDSDLNETMSPMTNPVNYAGTIVRGFYGLNGLLWKNSLALSAEIGMPLYQKADGRQMAENLTLNTGIKYTLHKS
jgi:hypothetical protein